MRTLLAIAFTAVLMISLGRREGACADTSSTVVSKINAALEPVQPHDAASMDLAEDQLVALGESNLTAIRQALAEKQKELAQLESTSTRPLGGALKLRREADTLD